MSRQRQTELMKKVVVKIGSAGLTSSQGGLDVKALARLGEDLISLQRQGLEIVLVSSGAIATAKTLMPQSRPEEISFLQASAAVGQPLLMAAYQDVFRRHQRLCAQVLLTHEDLRHKTRQFNTRNVLLELLGQGITPILNENDSVSFDEITVGDNDQLAAMVAILIDADALIILTGPDGLYDRDPAMEGAQAIQLVQDERQLRAIATKGKSALGRGGMATKLLAIKKAMAAGIPCYLGSYKLEQPVGRLLSQEVGTYFAVEARAKEQKRKSWLMAPAKNRAWISVDQGAYKALLRHGSLLPIGIKSLGGQFKRGDIIALKHQGKVFAVGLAEYDARDVELIKGMKSQHIAQVLGHCPTQVVVHRDNMYLTNNKMGAA